MIKTILKRNNILLSQFAADLNISRPTLDSYIKCYDNGEKISNNLFQKIFDFLFSDYQISNEEFLKKYSYIIDNYGKKTNVYYNSLMSRSISVSSTGSTNSAQPLIDYLSDDLLVNKYNYEEYNYLATLMLEESKLFKAIIKYKEILTNSKKYLELNEQEKMIVLSLYEINKKIDTNDNSYNMNLENEFINLINSNINKNKQYVSEEVSKIVNEYINNALNSNNVDIDEILNSIKSKLSEKEGK